MDHARRRRGPLLDRLLDLPAGRYVVDSVEEEPPVLTPEEEAGIEAALESYHQSRIVDD